MLSDLWGNTHGTRPFVATRRGCRDRTLCTQRRAERGCMMGSIIEVNEFEDSDGWEDFEDWFRVSGIDESGYVAVRPEEGREGKECRSRWQPEH